MKSYWVRHEGGRSILEPREVARPEPGPGQMVVRVRATALNRGDLLGAIAFHRSPGGRPAGVEAAGEVHAVGAGVDFKPGDRVMTRGRGCFAEYVLVDPAVATLIPPHLSWEQGAAIPTAFVTAWEAMVQYGRIKAREWMLVVGASSGVGVAAIQIGRVLGVRMIGVSGSPAKIEKLKALGLDEVIRARGEDFSARVLEATAGRGVDLAVNLVGGTAFAPCQKSLANFGRLAIVGYVDGTLDARFDLEATHGKRLEIFGISNAPLTPAMRAEATRGFVRDVMPAITDGRIVPVIDRVFPFDRMAEAKAYVETDAQIGKVVARLE